MYATAHIDSLMPHVYERCWSSGESIVWEKRSATTATIIVMIGTPQQIT